MNAKLVFRTGLSSLCGIKRKPGLDILETVTKFFGEKRLEVRISATKILSESLSLCVAGSDGQLWRAVRGRGPLRSESK